MKTRTNGLRRLAAVAGALALGLTGTLALSATAHADAIPGNINPDATGSIIIHKHVEDAGSTDYSPAGAPLEGVVFKVTEVLLNGQSVQLATSEAWEAIDDLTPAGIPGGGFTKGTETTLEATNASGIATASDLDVGLYLVEEVSSGGNLITTPAAPFLVTIPYPDAAGWLYNVDVYPKNLLGEVSPTKTVGTPDTEANVQLGAIVPFTITVPVAKQSLPYESFSISDSLSAGLEFSSWGQIKIGDQVLTPVTDYSISDDNTTVTLTTPGIAKLNTATTDAGTSVTAVINAEVKDLGQLDNTATATINGKPGTTPEVTTNWARLDITKVESGSATTMLANAEFELYAADRQTLLATGTTAVDGTLSFNVWVGNDQTVTRDVYLKETVAPQGYVLPADPWTGPITLTAGETAEASVVARTIENHKAKGPNLPLTGGQGTMLFLIAGVAIIGAAGGTLIFRKARA